MENDDAPRSTLWNFRPDRTYIGGPWPPEMGEVGHTRWFEGEEMKGDHEFRKKPKGSKVGGYARPRVQIGFNQEQMEVITRWAKHHNQSFAAEVRDLVSFAISKLS
jgi:hypothetical protein